MRYDGGEGAAVADVPSVAHALSASALSSAVAGVRQFLRVLAKLPSITKTLLEETKLEAFLNKLVAQHNGDEVIRSLVIKQLAAWDAVHNAYKIRKRLVRPGSPHWRRVSAPQS